MKPENNFPEIEIIVSTLLHVADKVMEVSRSHAITRIWDKDGSIFEDGFASYPGEEIPGINDLIVAKCEALVEEAFITHKGNYLKYTVDHDNPSVTYNLRVLPIHLDKDYLFITVENLSKKTEGGFIENKWKMALDAAGDGMWDLNVFTDKIVFSDKWHEIFGYASSEILTGAEWGAKIHPDDLLIAAEKRDAYLGGKERSYSAELRYLCKNGSYKWILSKGIIVSRTKDGKPLRFIGTHTDINERKLAEEKYAATADLMSKLINNLGSAILVTDENEKIIFANDMFYELYKMPKDDGQLLGMDIAHSLENRKQFYIEPGKFEERIKEILGRKEIVLNEELEMRDGRILSRDYLPLMLGANNKGEIWKFRDITSQKSVDRRFEEQRKFYENILNNIPADIAVFDAGHRYLFVNRSAFKNEELRRWMIGKTDVEYAAYSKRPQSFAEARFLLHDSAIKGRRKVEQIEKLVARDGSEGHHLRILNPVFYENGELEFLLAYGLDISELILAQQAIKANAEMFASAFDYSGIGMALISPGGKWLDVNNVICLQTGYSKEELLKLTFQDITYPEDLEMDLMLVRKMLRKEITTYTLEKRYVSKDRKIVLVSLTVSLVWNNDGSPKFFIAQVIDITKKKELENEIKRYNAELEATKVSLVNKIGQLEELSHIIAHNLRGPAGNVKMLAEVLELKNKGGAAAEGNALSKALTIGKISELIKESSGSLLDSLTTLMEITEIKLHKEIPYNDCNVSTIVNDITTQLLSTIYEKQAIIKTELEIESISYPRAYLENILYNFISNSLKYSQPRVQPQITIATRKKNDRIQVSVKDNGLGIDLEKYGGNMFRLNAIFHQGYDSKGVGLYITKTQVESLGGSIEVKSKEHEGCEFIVTL